MNINSALKIAVGIPAYGDTLTAHHARMWLEFGNVLGASHEKFRLGLFETIDVNPIDKARNMLLAHAITTQCDWLLMVDADTWVEGYGDEDAGFQLLRMIADAHRNDATIVCAAVVPRGGAPEGPSMVWVKDDNRMVSVYELGNERHLVEIHSCATACIAIDVRKAAEYNAHFKFSELSEDLDFCKQVREAGGKIFCDPRVRTGHKSRPAALYNSGT